VTTTTKIFVILVCLFAFIFTPLAISFAARTNNWRSLANDYRSELEVAYANERSVMAIAASEAERYKALIERERAQISDLQKKYNQSAQERNELKLKADELIRKADELEGSVKLLANEMKVMSDQNQQLTKDREGALDNERDMRVRNLDLSDRIKELSAKVVVASQQLNQRAQEVAACREENKQLRQDSGLGLSSGSQSAPLTPSAQPPAPARSGPVYGKVTKIQGSMATVDVGSASGVQPGMRLVVLRNGEWICDLEVTSQVLPTEAVGEVRQQADNKQIRPGDTVEDVDSFSRS